MCCESYRAQGVCKLDAKSCRPDSRVQKLGHLLRIMLTAFGVCHSSFIKFSLPLSSASICPHRETIEECLDPQTAFA